MDFAAAQDRVNAAALRGCGLVQLDGVAVRGDFVAAQKEHSVGAMTIAASDPMCTVASSDVPDAPVGKTLVPDGVTTYYIREVRPDGMGLTILELSLEQP